MYVNLKGGNVNLGSYGKPIFAKSIRQDYKDEKGNYLFLVQTL